MKEEYGNLKCSECENPTHYLVVFNNTLYSLCVKCGQLIDLTDELTDRKEFNYLMRKK